MLCSYLDLVGCLDWCNAELSPKRYWWGPRSQEVGEKGDYAYRYAVTTRMIPAFRRAAMRAILVNSLILRYKVTKPCPETTTFEERRPEPESNRSPSAYQPNALPLGQTGSLTNLALTRWCAQMLALRVDLIHR